MSNFKPRSRDGQPYEPVSLEKFSKATNSAVTRRRVTQAIVRICGIPEPEIINPINVATTDQDLRQQGTLYAVMNGQLKVFASTAFPDFLANNTHLDGQQALDLSADMSQAYGLLTRGIERTRDDDPPRTFAGSQQKAVWQLEGVVYPSVAMIYRAAATIAQESQGIAPLAINPEIKTPYMHHIAGLNNPLNLNEILLMREQVAAGI